MRTLITGLGVVAPNGLGADDYWAASLAGRSGIGPITRFDPEPYPVRLAGEIREFATSKLVPGRLVPQTDRWTHFGLAAAGLALADSGVDLAALPEFEKAVVTASSSGGTEFGQHEIENLWAKGPEWVGAYQSIAWFYAATTGQISIWQGMRGPCGVICTEQAGGLDAIGQARRMLRHGAQLVLTGGTDSSLCPYGLVAQLTTGRLSACPDPARAYVPFDAQASGYLPGEGGAILVTETADSAHARGVTGYGVIAGYAATFDPPPGSGREPGLRRAAQLALADAGLETGDVDVVFADAAGTLDLDRAEAAALVSLFGPHSVPVTAPKTMVGRLYAGGASLDVVAALLAIRDGLIPPTIGVTELADGCDIDLVRDAPRPVPVRVALLLARGYGGFNAALVLTRPDAD